MKSKYTIPKISQTTSLWYVHFRYDGKQFRYKYDLNKFEDLKERQIYFEELCKELLVDLKAGWNPNIKEKLHSTKSELTTIEALDLALKIKKETLQNDSYVNQRGKVNRFKKAIEFLKLDKVKIVDLKTRHYEMIFDKTVEMFSLTDNSFNQYKIVLNNIITLLVDEKILKRNFKLRIKDKKIIKLPSHVPANERQMLIIKDHLLILVQLLKYCQNRNKDLL